MCHVLIIEDDAIAAIDIQGALADAGATSFAFAATAHEAVRAARELRPGLITSDVMLESGFGPSAVLAIRQESGPIPVIFITATPYECEDCDPPHRVLEKPFARAALMAAFRGMAPI